MIVFIPSKARPQTTTYKLFESCGIKTIHFLEPQDYNTYQVPTKIDIGLNDGGISYVRNFMLKYAKDNNIEWALFCDDDVDHFGLYDNANIKKDASIWLEILEKAKKLPFELVGINYRQHAWHEKKPFSINTKFIEVCVLVNIRAIKWNYRKEFDLKEDRDFVLQCVKYGNGVLKFNKYFYNCPDIGSNTGGLYNAYKDKRDELSARKLAFEWQPFTEIKDKGGRLDVKVNLKELALHYKKTIK